MERTHDERPVRWAALLFGTLVLIAGCKKPEDDLGLDLIVGDDQLGLFETDTTTLRVTTKADSAVITGQLSRNILGSYVDRQFGSLTAGFAAQVRLTSNNVGQGDTVADLVADSVVLYLVYDGLTPYYGSLHPQVLRVHEVGETLTTVTDSTVYKSDRMPVTTGGDLIYFKGVPVQPEPFKRPVIDGDSLSARLMLRLEDDLAQRLLAAWGTNDVANNTNFLAFMKGLVVTAEQQTVPGKGGLLYFPLEGGSSKLTLYYHKTTVGAEDTLSYDFAINSSSARYTFVQRDPTLATDPGLLNALTGQDQSQRHCYLQTLGGFRSVIQFPHWAEYKAQGIDAVAKAELIVPIAGDFPIELPPPVISFVFRKNAEGKDVFLPDQESGVGLIGGNYNTSTRDYRFNISRYMQGLLNGTYENTGLQLVAGFNGVTGNRAVLAGPEHPVAPMLLKLTFTTH